MSIIENLYLFK